MKQNRMENFRRLRGMPWVKRGMMVELKGKKGRISGCNSSANLQITFDGQKHSRNCHPTWKMTYFDKDGVMIIKYDDGNVTPVEYGQAFKTEGESLSPRYQRMPMHGWTNHGESEK